MVPEPLAPGADLPAFIRGRGAVLQASDGRRYLDFVQGRGAHLLGHGHPAVVRALRHQAGRPGGTGTAPPGEAVLTALLRDALPSLERLRLLNSGTEAVMLAVRLARAATARPLVLKFDGCYHGHSDGLLVQAGSGLAGVGLPSSAGVDPRQASGSLSVPFNALAAVRAAFEAKPGKIAAVLVEPVLVNAGLIPPRQGFLSGLRRLCSDHGALLIFDEGVTAFRVGWRGAQGLYGVTPDLTTLGPLVGGGLPFGAVGGRRDLMGLLAPDGPVLHAGTLTGHPLVLAAGTAVLQRVRRPGFYERLETTTSYWAAGLRKLLTPGGQTLHALGGLFTLFFHTGSIHEASQALESDQDVYARFVRGLRAKGIFFPPEPFDVGFVGASHTRGLLDRALNAVEAVLLELHL